MLQSRLLMNLKGIGISFIPRYFFQINLDKIFNDILKYNIKDLEEIQTRVKYYNQINEFFTPTAKEKIGKFPFKDTSYAFDAYEISKYFKDEFLWNKEFGDVRHTFKEATICKSRSLEKNINNILLKLDKNRHFCFLKDNINYENKKDIAIFRGAVYQKHRKEFFDSYFGRTFCDIGDTSKQPSQWKKNFLNKKEQMKYKFIISLEGNDVASNLKWAMNSNSLVLAPKITCETWFMEGTLKPNYHFALIDNENLSAVIEYFKSRPKDALEIINNAHQYIKKFLDKKKEFHIGILVLTKYFYYSRQLELSKKRDILELIK
ncbi:glycosyl transferase family 90 [Campylobacter jejuni]|uniref:glycosyl transferase family 90 n=1 Tax=Campylobacter jejuni TaxID=197 RepID=UPI000F7FE8C4|nr:glycosyl transferase family 90 [Campylobacter jejuni]RTJ86804.1 lipopolysaccharide biosynthesis protein [Campylobacter jejuni]